MRPLLRDLPIDELTAVCEAAGEARFRAAQLARWLYVQGARRWEDMSNLPQRLRGELAATYDLAGLHVETEKTDGEGTTKVSWRLRDGRIVESVFMPQAGKPALCISSQAGCALGCRFCLTATMNLYRDLTPGEIVEQVLWGERVAGRRLNSIVFMGMGEPLAAYGSVRRAIETLVDPRGLGYSPRRVTVSTAGLVPGIESLSREPWPVNLAVSVNAPNDQLRSAIMPINRKYPLDLLLATLRRLPLRRRQRLTIEYVLLAGFNDHPDHARELARRLRGLRARINLIPLNPTKGIPFTRPRREVVEAFQAVLTGLGYRCFIRDSRGRAIRAACGNLAAGAPRRPHRPITLPSPSV